MTVIFAPLICIFTENEGYEIESRLEVKMFRRYQTQISQARTFLEQNSEHVFYEFVRVYV